MGHTMLSAREEINRFHCYWLSSKLDPKEKQIWKIYVNIQVSWQGYSNMASGGCAASQSEAKFDNSL